MQVHLRLLTLSTLPGQIPTVAQRVTNWLRLLRFHLDRSDFVHGTGDRQDFVVPAGERVVGRPTAGTNSEDVDSSRIKSHDALYAWLIAAMTPDCNG